MISSESVRAICETSGIANVTIIDDVFDPPALSLSAAERETLFYSFEQSADIRTAFQNIGAALNESADLTPTVFDQLKALAEQDDVGGQEAWAIISETAKARRAQLERMKQRLRRQLNLKVKSLGADVAGRRKKIVRDDSNVIFLDFELRPDEARGALSSLLVKRIYEQFKGQDTAPLVILMSSNKLTEEELDAFQNQTELLSGMFYFVQKDDLFSVEKLNYRLAAFAKSLSTGQTMQRFVHQVEAGLAEAKRKVFRDIRSLSIADYAFLQAVRLHDDGQPMGEYLMWMFNAHLIRELGMSSAVRTVEALVDDLKFDHLPPTQAKPSTSLGALYSSAVMRPVDPLPAAPTNSATYLQFGDFFHKDNTKKVWLCITPACDLAFGDNRPASSDGSVLFLPGELLAIDKPLKAYQQRQPRTELIQLKGKTYRVVWNTKEVGQTKFKNLKAWLDEKKVKRVARLNAPFAIEVQRAFVADLTRIGMPVPPPIYNPVKVRLSCVNEHGAEVELTTAATCGALISGGERGEKLVLGSEFMDALPTMLATAEIVAKARQKVLAAAQAGEHSQEVIDGAAQAQAKLAAARTDVAVLGGVRGPFKLQPDGLTVLDGLMHVFEASSTVDQPSATPLRLAVLALEEPVVGDAVAEEPEVARAKVV